jgi:hypothetical protein
VSAALRIKGGTVEHLRERGNLAPSWNVDDGSKVCPKCSERKPGRKFRVRVQGSARWVEGKLCNHCRMLRKRRRE